MDEFNNPVINAVGLTKTFRDFWGRPKAKAVSDIDFRINEGEVVGLLGPNGSGKSTAVKMILGLLYPTAGTLSVFGKSSRAVETKKMIGYLPEESYLYKYLDAMETLDFFGALFNLSRVERRQRAEQLLEMVGLTHARHRQVGEFSKGMARRIGLAQAMINDPSLLILDEPTSGLDPLGCKEVKDLVQLLKKRGKTVLITSHLLSDVEDICDRVIILYGGKIRAEGTINQLLTVTEANRIVTPMLSPEIMDKVIKILKNHLSGEEFKIDHPRRTLEEFFLDVIDKAKAESIETAGVVSGGRIADYLKPEDKSSAILAELTEEETPPPPDDAEFEPEETQAEIEEVDQTLSELTSENKSVDTIPEPTTPTEQEQLSHADEKLKDLLGGK